MTQPGMPKKAAKKVSGKAAAKKTAGGKVAKKAQPRKSGY